MWTDFSPAPQAEQVADLGTPVSPRVVRNWLEDDGLALHKIAKVLAGGRSPDREDQFQRIAGLKAEHLDAGHPVRLTFCFFVRREDFQREAAKMQRRKEESELGPGIDTTRPTANIAPHR